MLPPFASTSCAVVDGLGNTTKSDATAASGGDSPTSSINTRKQQDHRNVHEEQWEASRAATDTPKARKSGAASHASVART